MYNITVNKKKKRKEENNYLENLCISICVLVQSFISIKSIQKRSERKTFIFKKKVK